MMESRAEDAGLGAFFGGDGVCDERAQEGARVVREELQSDGHVGHEGPAISRGPHSQRR